MRNSIIYYLVYGYNIKLLDCIIGKKLLEIISLFLSVSKAFLKLYLNFFETLRTRIEEICHLKILKLAQIPVPSLITCVTLEVCNISEAQFPLL